MTTIVTVDVSSTITTQLEIAQTAIVLGILDLAVTQSISTSATPMNTITSLDGITLGNKGVSSANEQTTLAPTTVSTVVSSSTSTSVSTTAASTSTSTSSSTNQNIAGSFGTDVLVGSSSSTKTGLAIGIPVAVVGSALILLFLWYYIHTKRRQAKATDTRLYTHYDEKLNYRKSPSYSDYDIGAVYQVRGKPEALKRSMENRHNNENAGLPFSYNQSEISLKDPHRASRIDSKLWNLNTPLSKWFAKHSQVSANESSASLSTAPFSPIVALKEYKLMKSKRNEVQEVNEKSPIFPRFPEATYQPTNYHSTNHSVSSSESNISEQQLPVDFTRNITVPKINPVAQHKKKKKSKSKSNEFTNTDKPLPDKPMTSAKVLEGLEKRVYERMIPTTPVVDLKVVDDHIYKVIQEYVKSLADELTISKGEHLRVLARHTDGWCLVEKVTESGTPLGSGSGSYLNDNRGVIPEMCLIQTR